MKIMHFLAPSIKIHAGYYLLAAVILALVFRLTRKWTWSIFAGYMYLVFSSTIFARTGGAEMNYQLQLFWSYAFWSSEKWQIIGNVLMFIPIGIVLGKELGWRGIFPAAASSLMIEVMQLVTRRGLCELDDVLHNTLGAAIGIAVITVLGDLQVFDLSSRNKNLL